MPRSPLFGDERRVVEAHSICMPFARKSHNLSPQPPFVSTNADMRPIPLASPPPRRMFPHMVAATTSSSALGTQHSALPSSTTPSLPLLPSPDEALLTRLFETDAPSLNDLFKSLSQSPIDGSPKTLLDLCRWSQRGDIRPWLDFHASELAAAIRRRRIAKLEQIADTTKDLVEQRRACTTALRALSGGTPLRGVRNLPSSPTGGGGRAAAGGGSVSTSSTAAPITPSVTLQNRAGASPPPPSEPRPSGSGTHRHQRAQDSTTNSPLHSSPDSGPGTKDSGLPSPTPAHPLTSSPANPPAPSPIHPSTPSPIPDPLDRPAHLDSRAPHDTLESIIPHILTPRDPISYLTPLLAPAATINNTPIAARGPKSALATLPQFGTLAGASSVESRLDGDTFTWSARFEFDTGPHSTFSITLARTRPESRWLIHAISHMFDTG